MCTVSWWRKGDSYGVLFNRDESRTRLEALPPSICQGHGCSYLSPVDADAGGTWIWVNRAGIIGCVLNGRRRQDTDRHPGNPVSRGLLLKSLACRETLSSIRGALEQEALERYRSFFMLFLAIDGLVLFNWDGRELQAAGADQCVCPLTTSGYRPEEVKDYRTTQFVQLAGTGPYRSFEDLVSFHCQHDTDMPAHSVLMARPNARTVSQSRAHVEPSMVSISYAPVSPQVRLQPAKTIKLNRE